MAIKACRKGSTTSGWSSDPSFEKFELREKEAEIEFHMPSKGGGYTDVRVNIYPDSFEKLAKLMLHVDSKKAIEAFG